MKAFLSRKSQRLEAAEAEAQAKAEAEAKARMELGFGPPAAAMAKSTTKLASNQSKTMILEGKADTAGIEGLQVPKKFSGRWSRFRRKSGTTTNSSSIGNSSMDFWIYEVG